MVLWNHRLNLLHADARFADIVERVLYNGLLSGVSLDGEKFFYVNPLASRGKHHRKPWYACACCPTNMVRFMPTVGGYVYAYSADSIYVNLYVASRAAVPLEHGVVGLAQHTRYPWHGDVKIVVEPASAATFDVCLRMPGWCKDARLHVNGRPLNDFEVEKGYARIRREWHRGDTIELELPMAIQRMKSHPNVTANVGRVALQRGPIVYCLEAVDNGGAVFRLSLPRDADVVAEHRPGLLEGVTVVRGNALVPAAEDWDNILYRPVAEPNKVEFVAVPYYSWDNRAPGEMVVWLPETPGLAEIAGAGTETPDSKKE